MYLLISVLGLMLLSGCKKDEGPASKSPDSKLIISEIFNAGMAWNEEVRFLKSSYPINIGVDNYAWGPEGGSIHVSGSITGSMSINDDTGEVTGGTMLLGLTETINDYAFSQDGVVYTMNGAPYISLTGTFTLQPGGNGFGTASSMQIGGGIRVTGGGYDQTINVSITININSSGNGGNVSGHVGGEQVSYTF